MKLLNYNFAFKCINKILTMIVCILVGLSISHAETQKKEVLREEMLPSLIKSSQLKGPISFCGSKIPLERQDVRERLEKEMLLTLWDRAQVILWIKRASKYFPHMDKILKEEGLPLDLKYVAVIESSLRPHAGSSKGAVGFWQFLSSTGKRYGLRVDSSVDERRNLFTSTRAACAYLKDLYTQFKSWPLALAAYNMGENGLASRIKLQETNDYYSLYLSLETQRYLFKVIAARMIMQNPEKYGFIFSSENFYPVLSFAQINIESPVDVPLMLIASSAETSFKAIKDLNPEIRGYYLDKGKNTILIPKGKEKKFKKTFSTRFKKWHLGNKNRYHIVQKGEHLTMIAKKYKISIPLLLKLNKLGTKAVIHPGDKLIISTY